MFQNPEKPKRGDVLIGPGESLNLTILRRPITLSDGRSFWLELRTKTNEYGTATEVGEASKLVIYASNSEDSTLFSIIGKRCSVTQSFDTDEHEKIRLFFIDKYHEVVQALNDSDTRALKNLVSSIA